MLLTSLTAQSSAGFLWTVLRAAVKVTCSARYSSTTSWSAEYAIRLSGNESNKASWLKFCKEILLDHLPNCWICVLERWLRNMFWQGNVVCVEVRRHMVYSLDVGLLRIGGGWAGTGSGTTDSLVRRTRDVFSSQALQGDVAPARSWTA